MKTKFPSLFTIATLLLKDKVLELLSPEFVVTDTTITYKSIPFCWYYAGSHGLEVQCPLIDKDMRFRLDSADCADQAVRVLLESIECIKEACDQLVADIEYLNVSYNLKEFNIQASIHTTKTIKISKTGLQFDIFKPIADKTVALAVHDSLDTSNPCQNEFCTVDKYYSTRDHLVSGTLAEVAEIILKEYKI